VGASDADLAGFVRALRLVVGYSHEGKLRDDAAELMTSIGLRHDFDQGLVSVCRSQGGQETNAAPPVQLAIAYPLS
jgi:hypothetical protein